MKMDFKNNRIKAIKKKLNVKLRKRITEDDDKN